MNTMRGKQSPEGTVYELSAIIGLDGFDGEVELCGDIVAEICDMCCNFKLVNEGKSPTKMCKIIE